jgi:Ca-activated chloride channel homolog
MRGWIFTEFNDQEGQVSPFERLFRVFKEILVHTSGDVTEALSWMHEIDRAHGLTKPDYGMADFIQDLIDKGYLRQNERAGQGMVPAARLESALRRQALDDIFTDLRKSAPGNHRTRYFGQGDEKQPETRPYIFGDSPEQIAVTESLRNAQIRFGIDEFRLTPEDLEVSETSFQAQTATVLMIDISHSMILYGEDRITPAKKVAMALAELITTRYPKDTLDIIVFGDDAWPIAIRDLPYLQVGPYHTNTVAGLELAMDILRRRRNANKQIFMITDGKPTCIRKGKRYYKNSFGLDRQILRRTMNLALSARKLHIPITTFMIARDPWLVRFVEDFTRANAGKAFYAGLEGLGSFVFRDYKDNKRRSRP